MHAFCEDETILGQQFFVMSAVPGRVVAELPGGTKAELSPEVQFPYFAYYVRLCHCFAEAFSDCSLTVLLGGVVNGRCVHNCKHQLIVYLQTCTASTTKLSVWMALMATQLGPLEKSYLSLAVPGYDCFAVLK